MLNKFHVEVQRRLDAEAALKRRLGAVNRQATADARKAAAHIAELEAKLATKSEVLAGLNFALNQTQVELQELQKHVVVLPGTRRQRGGGIGAAAVRSRPNTNATIQASTRTDVGVKVLSVRELRMAQAAAAAGGGANSTTTTTTAATATATPAMAAAPATYPAITVKD